MAGAGKKTFTAGEVLTASDVNNYLMEQSVMVFGGTAARSSAIPTPSEGMTTYRTDTKQIESYDGAEWRGMSGLQLVKTQTIGSGVSSVTVTNAFSSTYDAYKIMVVGGAASANIELLFNFTGNTAGYYGGIIFKGFSSTTVSGNTQSNIGYWQAGYASTNNINVGMEIQAPFLTKKATFQMSSSVSNTSGSVVCANGFHDSATSFTGFTLTTSSGTLTGGTIYVYGYGA